MKQHVIHLCNSPPTKCERLMWVQKETWRNSLIKAGQAVSLDPPSERVQDKKLGKNCFVHDPITQLMAQASCWAGP